MRHVRVRPLAHHRFAVGAVVRLASIVPGGSRRGLTYEVIARLPECDGELQYRIKCTGEPWQRVAKENELEPV